MSAQTDPTRADKGAHDAQPAAPRIPGYRFERKLGQGGYAVVHLYQDEQLGRNVAVKVLSALDAAARRQFENEIRILSGFDSPYIVPMIHPGKTSEGRPYFLMPYCSGGSLAAAVGPEKPLPVDRAVQIGVSIAAALTAVHTRRIVHRDIKPSNILLDDEGRPRLSDFGTAGPLADTDPLAARDGFAVSVAWSPAEILAGAHGSIASDVYSLGATIWHLLIGRSPFEIPGGDNTPEALERRIRAGKLQQLRRPGVPPRLETLLRATLSLDPARRPKSAREVGAALTAALGSGGRATASDAAGQKTDFKPKKPQEPPGFPMTDARWGEPSDTHGELSPEGDRAKPGTRRRVMVLAGAAVGIGMAAVIGVSTLSRSAAGAGSGATATATGALVPAQDPQDPGVLGEHEPPGAPTVTAHRANSDAVAFAWTYSAALSSDTFIWRTTDGKRTGTTKSAALTLANPSGEQLCIEVRVVRADGSDASVDWSAPGCGS